MKHSKISYYWNIIKFHMVTVITFTYTTKGLIVFLFPIMLHSLFVVFSLYGPTLFREEVIV